jgi:hypothetical protein
MKHVKDDITFLKSDITKSRIYNMERYQNIEQDIKEMKQRVCGKTKAS